MTSSRYIIFALLCALFSASASAQQANEQATKKAPPSSLLVSDDTLDVQTQYYTTAVDFYHVRTELTDSVNALTHQYDPARREYLHYGTLGNLGSAARSHLFDPVKSKGLDYGHHQYDLYKRRFAEFKFYDSETTITEFDYSQGAPQLDGILKARFGRNFAKGIKLSLDYQRINQTGRFQQQRAKHTALGVGIWYDSPSGFYDGLYHYSTNSIVQQDNGGVINYDTISAVPDPVAVPVNLFDALTTHRERVFSVQNHFHLRSKYDSIPRKFLVDIIHTGQYINGLIKYYDEDIRGSEDYYDGFLVDAQGARQYLSFRSLNNRADMQFRLRGAHSQHDDISSHLFRVGLQYRYTSLNQEPENRSLNEIFLNASTRISFTRQMDLRASGYLELTGQTGDFNLEGALRYQIPSLGRVEAQASFYQRSPNVMERTLYVTQIPVWTNDYNKPLYTRLGFEAKLDGIRAYAYGGLQVISNHIYFDFDRMPQQLTQAQDVWQILLSKEISVGKVGLQMTAAFQEAPDVLALPTWIGQAQFYYTDWWFKGNMQVRTGVDLRVTDTYDGVSYFPLTGQFHQSNLRIEQYPAMDVFFDMQVKQAFRAFFKLENFSAWFIDDVYAHAAYYPQFNTYFRFGLWMKLFD